MYCMKCQAWLGCLGLEPTPELFIQHLVEIFREVKRVLRDDGVCWIVIGDSFAGSNKGVMSDGSIVGGTKQQTNQGTMQGNIPKGFSSSVIKPKDLIGIPWMLAFALRADGWYLRRDIIWAKGVSFCSTYSGSSMPESVQDRPSSSHEYVFLLSKSKRYFYDNEAVKEPSVYPNDNRKARSNPKHQKRYPTKEVAGIREGSATYPKRNLRSVWTINTRGFSGAHFATYPLELVEPMILAGTSARGCCSICGSPWKRVVEKPDMAERPRRAGGSKSLNEWQGATSAGQKYQDWRNVNPDQTLGWRPTCSCYDDAIAEFGTGPYNQDKQELFEYHLIDRVGITPCLVLDPFCGSGTTGIAAIKHKRNFIGLDLSKKYLHELAQKRLDGVQVTLL